MIHLVDVTEENRLEIAALSVKDEQRQWAHWSGFRSQRIAAGRGWELCCFRIAVEDEK